jgi:hypothetical protein
VGGGGKQNKTGPGTLAEHNIGSDLLSVRGDCPRHLAGVNRVQISNLFVGAVQLVLIVGVGQTYNYYPS